METIKNYGLTDSQIKDLKEGHVIEVNGSKLMLKDKQVYRVTNSTSAKPRFTIFYAPNRSTTSVCVFSEENFKDAIAEYLKHGESMPRVKAYKRNGEKDANGQNVPLKDQIENGTARVIEFAVTKSLEHAYKVGALASCYIDENGEPWYIRNDVKETTANLATSAWEIKEPVRVSRIVEEVTF